VEEDGSAAAQKIAARASGEGEESWRGVCACVFAV